MTAAQPTSRLYQLQSLRFVAAALVLIGHVFMEARQHGASVANGIYDFPWGGGVDVFFVISGFIILFIDNPAALGARASLSFLLKRIIRIVPLYWLFTLAMLAVFVVTPHSVRGGVPGAADVVKSLLFIPYVAPGGDGVRPILAQGWTLNFEMFFYLLFALGILLVRNRYAAVSLALAAALLLGWLVPLPAPARFLFSLLLFYFIAGMTLAHLRPRLPTIGTPLVAVLIAVAVALAILVPGSDETVALRMASRGLPAFLLVFATVQWRDPPAWVTRGTVPLLGDASYALYLSHPFVFNAVLIMLAKLHWAVTPLAMAVGALLAVAASVVIHLLVERPVLHLLTEAVRRYRLDRPAPTGMDRSDPLHGATIPASDPRA